MDKYTVAIVGRPNVGKSSLFNRLIGKKHAIVDDFAGVTRDWREGDAKIGPLSFKVIDTAGLERDAKDDLARKIKQVTIDALEMANLIFFVVDGRIGVTNEDMVFAKWLRKNSTKTAVIVNKSESSNIRVYLQDYFKLGLGEPVFISAQQGLGMVDLFDVVNQNIEDYLSQKENNDIKNLDDSDSVSIAIVGRPNAGKSTLVNQLLKKERMVTGDMPGTTRDSIALEYNFNGQVIKLIDTAGIKKRSSIKDELEEMTYEDSKRAIRFAHVVILTLDATIAFEKQDISIANMAINEGRPLIIAINKWDKISDKSRYNNALVDSLAELLPEVKDAPVIYISAISGHNVNKLMQAAIESYQNWNIRISTAKLNTWLAEKLAAHSLPLGTNAKRVKIKYITQHNTRPPSFVLFSNLPEDVSDNYIRYLKNSLKEDFALKGIAVRMHCKKSNNPYS